MRQEIIRSEIHCDLKIRTSQPGKLDTWNIFIHFFPQIHPSGLVVHSLSHSFIHSLNKLLVDELIYFRYKNEVKWPLFCGGLKFRVKWGW